MLMASSNKKTVNILILGILIAIIIGTGTSSALWYLSLGLTIIVLLSTYRIWLNKPFVIFCLLVFLMALGDISKLYSYGNFSILIIFGFLLLISVIINLLFKKYNLIKIDSLQIAIIIFFSINILSTLINGNNISGQGTYYLRTYMQLIILIFCGLVIIKDHCSIDRIIRIIIISICIRIILGLLLGIFAPQSYLTTVLSINGFNREVGADIAMNIPFILYFIDLKENNKILLYITLFISIIGVIYSGSRGALLALVIMLIIMVFKGKKMRKKGFITGFIIITIFIIIFHFFNFIVSERIARTMTEIYAQNIEKLGTNRVGIWIDGINIFKNNYLIGVGPGNFSDSFGKLNMSYIYDNPAAHNVYLNVLCELGIIGFLLFLYIIIKTYINYRKALKQYYSIGQHRLVLLCKYCQLSLIIWLIVGFSLDTQLSKYAWLLFGFSIITYNESKKGLNQ